MDQTEIANIENKYNVFICKEETAFSHKHLGFVAYDTDNHEKICSGNSIERLVINLRRAKTGGKEHVQRI